MGAGIWWTVSGIIASLVGGYVAGRLSGKPKPSTTSWHGLIAWAVTTLLVFYLLTSAIGGLVGINHRVDVTALRQLVSDGNADRVLFPDKLVERADEVMSALSASFPPARGRFVIAPMVRISSA